jgi:hypothetical protein
MVLIRHTATAVELDVPEEAVQYFPDYEPVKDESEPQRARKSEPTTPKE